MEVTTPSPDVVPPGYQQTEVGVVPTEWHVVPISARFAVSAGGDLDPSLSTAERDYSHRYPIYSNALTAEGLYGYCSYADHPAGSITVTARGTLGSARYRDHEYTAIGRVLVLEPKTETAGPFFAEFINSRIRFTVESTGVPQLTAPQIGGYSVAVPPYAEQRAISTVLSDADALLHGLDRLIAKKRALKQAAMQQLFTGRTRLPGFRGDWRFKTLGELGATFSGLTGKCKSDFGTGQAHYVTFMNVIANVVVDCEAFEQVSVSFTESQNRLLKGDLLFNGSSETPEDVAMCAVLTESVPDLFLNSFCFGFRLYATAEADGLFLAYYLRSTVGRELMKSLAQGSTRYNVSKLALLRSQLRLPSLPEQTAIAAVLTDMDEELSALEKRRAKTLALKQGMMQELLTGRTRLV